MYDTSTAMVCSCTLGDNTPVIIQSSLLHKEAIKEGVKKVEDVKDEEEIDCEPVQSTLVINLVDSHTGAKTPIIEIIDGVKEDQVVKNGEEFVDIDMNKDEEKNPPGPVLETDIDGDLMEEPEKKKSVMEKLLSCFKCFHRPGKKKELS